MAIKTKHLEQLERQLGDNLANSFADDRQKQSLENRVKQYLLGSGETDTPLVRRIVKAALVANALPEQQWRGLSMASQLLANEVAKACNKGRI